MLDIVTHLFRLQAIVEESSLRRAAARLNVTQSALSRSLAQLEAYFGRPILERHARGVRPTPFGERVLSESLRLQRQWTISEQSLLVNAVQEKPVLRVGAGPVWRALVLPELVISMHQAFPDIRFELQNSRYSQSVSDLSEGRLDVLFTGQPPIESAARRLVFHPVAEVVDNVVARCDHPIFDQVKEGELLPADVLLDYSWVIYSEMPIYGETARNALFEKTGAEPTIAVSCESLMSVLTILQGGDFISVLPGIAARGNSRLRNVPVDLRSRTSTASLAYREEMQDWEPLQGLIAHADALFRDGEWM